jgi:hypothetical protein
MKKDSKFVICLVALLLVSIAFVPRQGTGAAADASQIKLRNHRMTLVLDKTKKGAIVSLVDNARNVEFIAPQATPRLFNLAFSKKAEVGGKVFYLSSHDAKSFSSGLKRGVATLNYNGLGEWPVQVTCTASLSEKDTLVGWRLSMQIPESLVLEGVQFPIVVLRAPLGESADDDAAVFGQAKGGVIRNLAGLKVGSRFSGRQPGSLVAQFGCYYDDRAGIYMASYDNKGYPKDFEILRTNDGVEMDWKLNTYTEKSYTMNFDMVLTTFSGVNKATPADWRDAADIYKGWALQQPWCATAYAQRTDIPAWMKEGPAMVRFTREWLTDPSSIMKWLTDYWKKNFPDIPLITAYWGWEKIWYWITPDYFPVYPSNEQFSKLVAQSRLLGCHAFPWPSGYHWTLTYKKQADGSFFWDDRKRFDEVARAHAIHKSDGQLYIREKPFWLEGGDNACMCPGDPWTIRWWNEDICAPLTRLGSEIIQVDQVVGGGFPFCYKREHPHPAGPGLWMTEVFIKQLKTMHETMQKIEPEALVCVEEPNELFNHLVAIQDYRDCESKLEWASVYNYIYHEFLPTFQSNPQTADIVMSAYCLVNGQLPLMRPSPLDIGVIPESTAQNKQPAASSVESKQLMHRWIEIYHGEGRPWLQFGRMLHPPKLTCGTITYREKKIPAVLHNAFRAPDGSEAVVLANATLEPQTTTLNWKGKEVRLEFKPGEIVLYR